MKFRPCIDLHQGKVKQIIGGTLNAGPNSIVENFVSENGADFYAKMFQADNLSGGHVIMLDNGGETQKEALRALAAYPKGLQIGGGISADNAAYFLEQGASHVIITSSAFKGGKINYNNLEKLVEKIGQEKIVLDISCRKKNGKYYIVTDKWQVLSKIELTPEIINRLSKYCAEFLVHGVDVEGLAKGIDEELVKKLGAWVQIPTVYAGGISSLDNLNKIKSLGQNRIDATIGSALDIYGGKLPYAEVVKWFKCNQ